MNATGAARRRGGTDGARRMEKFCDVLGREAALDAAELLGKRNRRRYEEKTRSTAGWQGVVAPGLCGSDWSSTAPAMSC